MARRAESGTWVIEAGAPRDLQVTTASSSAAHDGQAKESAGASRNLMGASGSDVVTSNSAPQEGQANDPADACESWVSALDLSSYSAAQAGHAMAPPS